MKLTRSLIPAALLLALGACNSYPASADANHRDQFHQISSELEAGGSFYMIANQSDDMKAAGAQMRSFAKMAADEPVAAALYNGLANFYEKSGVTSTVGTGISTVERADGLQRSRIVVAYSQAQPEIFKLSPDGQPAWDLGARLPADTVAAFGFSLDIRKALELACASAPELSQLIEKFYVDAEDKGCPADLKALAESDPVCLAFGLTLDAKETLRLPQVGAIPLPGAVTLIKVDAAKRDAVKLLLKELSRPAGLKHDESETEESWTSREVAPGVAPCIVLKGDLLVIGSRIAQVKQALAGQGGLMQSPEWLNLATGLPARGDSFFYVSERIGHEVKSRLVEAVRKEKSTPKEVVDTLEQHFSSSRFSVLAISAQKKHTAGLYVTSTHGPLSLGTAAVGGVMAAMVLPALGSVREKAQITKSKNSLKQHALTMQSYFSDGTSTKFPEDMKQMGFDENMLNAPTHEGQHFTVADLVAGRADYVLVNTDLTWAEVNNPSTVLMFEKPNLHGNQLNGVLAAFGDGHVEVIPGHFANVEAVIEAVRLKK